LPKKATKPCFVFNEHVISDSDHWLLVETCFSLLNRFFSCWTSYNDRWHYRRMLANSTRCITVMILHLTN